MLREESEVTKGTGTFTLQLLFWMSLIVFIGVGFSTLLVDFPGLSPAQSFISYFQDSLVYPLLISGFIAALLSTADTFLISSVQTILVDWKYARALVQAGYRAENLSAETHRQMIKFSRIGIPFFGFLCVLAGYLFFTSLPSLLDLLFVIFAIQASLFIPVIWGLLKNPDPVDKDASIGSIIVGGVIGIVCLILAMKQIPLLGVGIGFWAPILVLFVSTVTFFLIHTIFKKGPNSQ